MPNGRLLRELRFGRGRAQEPVRQAPHAKPRNVLRRPYAPPRDCGNSNQIGHVILLSSGVVPSSFRQVMQKGDSGQIRARCPRVGPYSRRQTADRSLRREGRNARLAAVEAALAERPAA
jgi:hypothetical protein